MKILVLGLWHLGSVTAACCARYFEVVGLDFDEEVIKRLSRGTPALYEPGLEDLLREGLAEKRLSFASGIEPGVYDSDILWVCYDTPVDDNDQPDVESVLQKIRLVIPCLSRNTAILISSQLPVGTCARLEAEYPDYHFAVSPENLRLGRALDAFNKPDRVIVGLRKDGLKERMTRLFAPFSENIIFMRTESAEMVKHGINAFLAASVVFINELASLGEHFGADAAEVSEGLKSDVRIGKRAYLRPGSAFAGGTLARDVVTLLNLAKQQGEKIPLLSGVMQSNANHQEWALRKLQAFLEDLKGRKICILGLTYTPNTNTLRRSSALDLCRHLHRHGARVFAYDPAIQEPCEELEGIAIANSITEAVQGADALVICTEWPEFRTAPWQETVDLMNQPLVLDANGFLEKQLQSVPGVKYVSVGRLQPQNLS